MSEKWDAYDSNFNRIDNLILERGQRLPGGVYHLVSEIAVKHIDGTYLLMQRDFCKHFGGMWELTAGGSALQGESPMECAIRELKEETGIEAADLIELDRIIHHPPPISRYMLSFYTLLIAVRKRLNSKKMKRSHINGQQEKKY